MQPLNLALPVGLAVFVLLYYLLVPRQERDVWDRRLMFPSIIVAVALMLIWGARPGQWAGFVLLVAFGVYRMYGLRRP